ncbi:MAG: bile acid:sodium symporter family protein [Polyangiales bacterium]
MDDSLLTKVLLPLALFIIMWGLGLSLTWADFKRGAEKPLPVALGVFCQMVLLPLLGFGVAMAFGLTGPLAVGLIILSLCPGGVTSNLLSFLSKGDLALSITLTAISSVLTPFTVPLVAGIAFTTFGMDAAEVALPIPKTMLTLVAITILPVGIGMLIRRFKPGFAKAAERPIRIASALFLALIIAGVVKQNIDDLAEFFVRAGPAALILNVVSMASGLLLAKLMKFGRPQAITIGMEVGVQNGTTAIFITSTLLANPEMSIAPAVYSLIMFVTGALFGVLMNRGRSAEDDAAADPATS